MVIIQKKTIKDGTERKTIETMVFIMKLPKKQEKNCRSKEHMLINTEEIIRW